MVSAIRGVTLAAVTLVLCCLGLSFVVLTEEGRSELVSVPEGMGEAEGEVGNPAAWGYGHVGGDDESWVAAGWKMCKGKSQVRVCVWTGCRQ